jgi:hypothetical protein
MIRHTTFDQAVLGLRWTITIVLLGSFAGAGFGVAFGAVASIFQNGPDLAEGIRESWWWFAIAGSLIAIGWVRSRIADLSRRDRRAAPVRVRVP